MIITARGLQLGLDEARARFARATAVAPQHLRAHQQMLQFVCAKWFGSNDEMHDFARTSMMRAPGGSPLGVLVAMAHLEHALFSYAEKNWLKYLRSRSVRSSLHEAADRSVRHSDYRRGRDWAVVHGTFAATFALANEHRAAAEQFRIVGDIVAASPWDYFEDPGRLFCTYRNRAYANS